MTNNPMTAAHHGVWARTASILLGMILAVASPDLTHAQFLAPHGSEANQKPDFAIKYNGLCFQTENDLIQGSGWSTAPVIKIVNDSDDQLDGWFYRGWNFSALLLTFRGLDGLGHWESHSQFFLLPTPKTKDTSERGWVKLPENLLRGETACLQLNNRLCDCVTVIAPTKSLEAAPEPRTFPLAALAFIAAVWFRRRARFHLGS